MKQRFFDEARKESQLSDYNRAHLGAVAVYKDKFILARAHNSQKTNPTQYFYNKYRIEGKSTIMQTPPRSHAEVNLYRKIRYLDIDFKDITVYIYRELKDGTKAISRPCPSCRELLQSTGIRTVCYTTENGFAEERYDIRSTL